MGENSAARPDLPRVLGVTSVIGIVMGTMIGSGIFIVPAVIAARLGSPVLMLAVWVAGGLLTFFGALSMSELGAAFPQAGGMYIYLKETYGPLVGFLFGWALFLVIESGTFATLAVGFSTKYLPYFVKMTPLGSKAVAIALITLLCAVNYFGVRRGALLQNALTSIKFAALAGLCFAVFVFAKGSAAHFVTPAPGRISAGLVGQFGLALVAALWAYKGWECSSFSSGELRNPTRDLPLGIFIGTSLVITLYLLANLAYLYVFPASAIAKSGRIAADAMNFAIGPVGASIIAFIILFSIAGAANGHCLTSPRVYFAMARDGLFFRKFGEVHPKYLTPHVSIVALGVWSAVLSLTGSFEQLYTYVIFGLWLFMGLTIAAVIILRKKRPDLARPYRTWGYPVTPILFILSALFISINMLINQTKESLVGLGIILLGVPAYIFWKKRGESRVTSETAGRGEK
jgi:APA family basic amino acid/polyamine antiporter